MLDFGEAGSEGLITISAQEEASERPWVEGLDRNLRRAAGEKLSYKAAGAGRGDEAYMPVTESVDDVGGR